ncbi:hypothetical protein MRX96_040923 [Rhipicephalus microplus]
MLVDALPFARLSDTRRSVATIEGYGEAETMRFFIIVLIVVASMILVLLALILFGVIWSTTMDHYEEESTVKFFLFMTLVVSAVVFVLLGLMLFGFVQGINNFDYSNHPSALPKTMLRVVD